MFVAKSQKMTMLEIRRIKNSRLIFLISSQSLGHLICGGFVSGSGVCIMHYMGFWAMEFRGHIVWNKGIIAASLLIALIAENTAFWMLFRLLSLYPHKELLRIGSACFMALAVCGMHYAGMAAARFEFEGDVSDLARYGALTGSINGYNAFYGTLTTATIFVMVLLILALADLRAWHYNVLKHLQRAEDVILKMQQTTGTHPGQSQQILQQYLVSKEIEKTYRSNLSLTVSNRTGILTKP
eukprot:gene39252-48488_t